MERAYLLKVIDKHFWALSKEEIAAQATSNNFGLPEFLIEALQKQDAKLDNTENLKLFHPYFTDVVNEVREGIISADENRHNTPKQRERLFDQSLWLISVYYRYSAVMNNTLIADFIRLILMRKVLLT